MKHFINIVWENKDIAELDEYLVDTVLECADEGLLEDETNYETFDTIDGGVVMAVELHTVSYTHLTLPTTCSV